MVPRRRSRTTTIEVPGRGAAVYAATAPSAESTGSHASSPGREARRTRPLARSCTKTSERSPVGVWTSDVNAIRRPSADSRGSEASPARAGGRTRSSAPERMSRTTTSVRDSERSGCW